MPQPYSCADISKGQEPISVKAVNLYTFDELPLLEFQYTATTSIDPEIDQLFLPNQGCSCISCEEDSCPCLFSGQISNDTNKRLNYTQFCDSTSGCVCTSEVCRPDLFQTTDFKLNFNVEVYFVNTRKKWGVRCCKQPIEMDNFVCEYVGVLRKSKKAKENAEEHNPFVYVFNFGFENKAFDIDASKMGNVARFVNHSCEPNLHAIVTVCGPRIVPRIMFFSMRFIPKGEELTIDYGEQWWRNAINANPEMECVCGSLKCNYKRI
ncbi:SET domain-containing protein [Ditylenchus destructor]|uniref:SET domain-containing protein n=1 Tax=Ditylenchus destructor TaxID=166010 RepID=A0AAD4NEK4_9BILA|nr:SET domain-containing protein [Ditylenchus destructor]